ncbi:MAG: dihydroorotate dehydrogenase [Chloroflexota bacterium]
MRRKRSVVTDRDVSALPRTPRGRARATTRPAVPRVVTAPSTALGAGPVEADLSVDLAPTRAGALVLHNPVLVASGTFGYGIEYGEVVDVERLGAICCKGHDPQGSDRQPAAPGDRDSGRHAQLHRPPEPGVEAVLERYAPRWATWQVPVLVNVAGRTVEDYVAVARRLDGQPGVAGIELNISCPNAGRGGIQFALDASAAAEVTRAVRRATDLPLLVKLSPAATDVRAIATAIEDAGADAICAVNTLSGMAIDRRARKPLLGNAYGGLSGPALKPVALRVVYEVAQVVDIPIVGIGGVGSLEDVLDLMMAGACAVQVGTAVFADRCCRCGSWTSLGHGARRMGWRRIGTSWVRRSRGVAIDRRQGRGVPAMSAARRVRPACRWAGAPEDGRMRADGDARPGPWPPPPRTAARGTAA